MIPWRDAGSLIRFPARLGTAVLAVGAAAALLGWAQTATGPDRTGLTLAGWLAFYLAGTQLIETARLEADDPGRADPLGPGFPAIAVAHAVVPVMVLILTGLLAAAVGSIGLGGTGALPLWLLPLAAPETIAAGLISAYRGPQPLGLLVGVDTPFGNTGPLGLALWYLRGTLIMLLTLTALTRGLAGSSHHLSDLPIAGAVALLLGNTGLRWVRRLAANLQRAL